MLFSIVFSGMCGTWIYQYNDILDPNVRDCICEEWSIKEKAH
jgi:hypothetical protein